METLGHITWKLLKNKLLLFLKIFVKKIMNYILSIKMGVFIEYPPGIHFFFFLPFKVKCIWCTLRGRLRG